MTRESDRYDAMGGTETRLSGSFDGFFPDSLRIPALTVAAHPDHRRVGEMATLPEVSAGERVELSRLAPAFADPESRTARPLAESHLSRQPIVLSEGPSPASLLLDARGTRTRIEVDGDRVEETRVLCHEEIDNGAVLELGHRVVLVLHWHLPVRPGAPSYGLVGESSLIGHLRHEIRVVSGLDTPVLVRGESGTGKELVARAIHSEGRRSDGPWIAVNMAAIEGSVAVSELFGQAGEAGAVKRGYFQRAQGGTLFLDEVGETPPEVQPLLLRTLETGEVQAVGSAKTQGVDVRVIAATDANLEALVAGGRFREPLKHRLAGYEIRVPPLRLRRCDIGRLLYRFLHEELSKIHEADRLERPDSRGRPWPAAGIVAQLARFDWPGNVRQLRNVARQLAIGQSATESGGVEPSIDQLLVSAAAEPAGTGSGTGLGMPVSAMPEESSTTLGGHRRAEDVSEGELLAALRSNRFELKPTALELGVSRSVLYDLIEANPKIRKPASLQAREIEDALARASSDIDGAAAELGVSRQGLLRRMKLLGMITGTYR